MLVLHWFWVALIPLVLRCTLFILTEGNFYMGGFFSFFQRFLPSLQHWSIAVCHHGFRFVGCNVHLWESMAWKHGSAVFVRARTDSFCQLEDAVQLVQRAILAGIFNDLGSGGNVDVTVITTDGADIRRNCLTPNERLFRNEKGRVSGWLAKWYWGCVLV